MNSVGSVLVMAPAAKPHLPEDWAQSLTDQLIQRPDVVEEPFSVRFEITMNDKSTQSAAWSVSSEGAKTQDSIDATVIGALTEPDAVGVVSGEVPLPVAFMRGRLKLTGDPKTALIFLKAAAPV